MMHAADDRRSDASSSDTGPPQRLPVHFVRVYGLLHACLRTDERRRWCRVTRCRLLTSLQAAA